MNRRVRAIIEVGDDVLLIHRVKAGKEYWVFPGGGVEECDASEKDALIREAREELGVLVSIGDLFAALTSSDSEELFYRCSIASGSLGTGTGPELMRDPTISGSYEVQWVSKSDMEGRSVYPLEIRDMLLGKTQ